MSNWWNDVSVGENVLISIVQLLKWCQCLRRWCQFVRICANFYCPTVEMMSVVWEDVLNFYRLTVEYDVNVWEYVLIFYCPTVEMMSVLEKMCSISIVQLLKWCQCLRICAQFLLSNNWNNVSVWDDMLDVYCPTVKMMSVFEKMC